MANSSKRRITSMSVSLVVIEALTVSAFVLSLLTLVAGRYSDSLRQYTILTFDTSSLRTQLASQGISNATNIQDWYEPHYLSVCKGMWQSSAAAGGNQRAKNASSTVCKATSGGYKFSLLELLAADTGLPVDSPLLSAWSFAVINTKAPFILLNFAIAFTNWAIINYLVTIMIAPNLTTVSPLYWPRWGFIASIVALNTLIISSAMITATMSKVLGAKLVVEEGVAWSIGGFYVLTWVATGLMCVAVIMAVVLAFKVRPPPTTTSSSKAQPEEFDSTAVEYSSSFPTKGS